MYPQRLHRPCTRWLGTGTTHVPICQQHAGWGSPLCRHCHHTAASSTRAVHPPGPLRRTFQWPPAALHRLLGRSPTLPRQHLLANRTRCPAELQGPGSHPTPTPPRQPAARRQLKTTSQMQRLTACPLWAPTGSSPQGGEAKRASLRYSWLHLPSMGSVMLCNVHQQEEVLVVSAILVVTNVITCSVATCITNTGLL
jgi:hypothetical protein